MRAICIGECMVELRQSDGDRYVRAFAGDAYNTAVYLKRSAPHLHVAFLTATGEDPLSHAMRNAFAAEGIEDELVFTAKGHEPGLYMIELDSMGERRFHYWRSASAARQWFALLMQNGGAERLAGADLLYLSGISLAILPDDGARAEAIDLLAFMKNRVGLIAFDTNVRPALWRDIHAAREAIAPMIEIADILRASREDAALLCGICEPKAQIGALRAGGAHEIVLTLGGEGCIVAAENSETALPASAVKIRDTTGAGDAFTGAYLAARLGDVAPLDAARGALKIASRVVTYPGAIVPAEISHPREAGC
jgi:2-dehydro-3-deoxygluconokinase